MVEAAAEIIGDAEAAVSAARAGEGKGGVAVDVVGAGGEVDVGGDVVDGAVELDGDAADGVNGADEDFIVDFDEIVYFDVENVAGGVHKGAGAVFGGATAGGAGVGFVELAGGAAAPAGAFDPEVAGEGEADALAGGLVEANDHDGVGEAAFVGADGEDVGAAVGVLV